MSGVVARQRPRVKEFQSSRPNFCPSTDTPERVFSVAFNRSNLLIFNNLSGGYDRRIQNKFADYTLRFSRESNSIFTIF